MTSIDSYFDKTFDCFSDAFLNPLFSQREYELFMTNCRQSIQSALNNPGSMLFYYSQKLLYDGHPYQTSSAVTIDSVENITLSAIRTFHSSLLDSRRISVVACGSFSVPELLEKLNETLGTLHAGKNALKDTAVEPLSVFGENAVFVHQAAAGAPASDTDCFSPAPGPGRPGWPPAFFACIFPPIVLHSDRLIIARNLLSSY